MYRPPAPVTCYACMTHATAKGSSASDEDEERPTITNQKENQEKQEETQKGVGRESGT